MKEKINVDLIVKDIPMSKILDNPYQPRKRYGKKAIKILAKNIYERGLFHPIAVVRVKEKYVIVSGHRRKRAYKILRRKTIPAIIRKKTTQKDLALDLAIENALRKDFAPIEKAESIFQVLKTIKNVQDNLLRAYSLVNQVKLMNTRGLEKVKSSKGHSIGFTDDDIFKCVRLLNLMGVAENTATSYLRLLSLPKQIQDKILVYSSNETKALEHYEQGVISVKMGYELSRVKSDKLKSILYKKIIEDKLRYIQVRHIVDEILEQDESQMISKLGTSKRKGDDDYGVAHLTKRCFNLSASLWNFRRFMPILQLSLDKVIFRAGLVKLKKICIRLANEITDILKEEVSIKERIELVNQELEVQIHYFRKKGMFRFSLPMRKIKSLGLKDKDRLKLEIKEVIR